MPFIHLESERRSYRKFRGHKKGRVLRLPALSLSRGVRCYRTNLRASRPLPTKRTPAPSAMSAGVPTPPDGGSALAAGAGAGPGAGAGAGAGAALGGGGGAGAAFGGSGSHGALATTPPAL